MHLCPCFTLDRAFAPDTLQGSAGLCIAHGGGARCSEPECTKFSQGPTGKCFAHGKSAANEIFFQTPLPGGPLRLGNRVLSALCSQRLNFRSALWIISLFFVPRGTAADGAACTRAAPWLRKVRAATARATAAAGAASGPDKYWALDLPKFSQKRCQ